MRLVSGYYEDFYPFDALPGIDEFNSTSDPDTLRRNDILIIWGGGDIHPSLYGKEASPQSGAGRSPSHRDKVEWALMQRASELNIPIIGVCRGAQMLCALAGGFLVQHVNNHGGYHKVVTNDGKQFEVNSIHHQMMVPKGTEHELIATTKRPLSDQYWDEDRLITVEAEPELIYFNDVKGFAVQWHPEMLEKHSTANQYFLDFIQQRI